MQATFNLKPQLAVLQESRDALRIPACPGIRTVDVRVAAWVLSPDARDVGDDNTKVTSLSLLACKRTNACANSVSPLKS